MGCVFLVCGLGGLGLILYWESVYPSLANYLGTNPVSGRNEMLDAFYPVLLWIATGAFLAYSILGFLSTFGLVCGGQLTQWKWPSQVYFWASLVVVVLCLTGHVYMFVFLPWYKTDTLVVTVIFNGLWYVWWIYSTVIVGLYLKSNYTIVHQANAIGENERFNQY